MVAASPNSRKSRVLVVSGFGVKISRQMGEIQIEDGVADHRRIIRVPRVTRHLRRIIVISSDGYCTFEAVRTIADIGATLIFLDRRGKLLFASGPTAASDVRLRRSQSLALTNGTALRISKELIRQKLEGQAALVRDMLNDPEAAGAITEFSLNLSYAESIESVRLTESLAAKIYWGAWADVPVRWTRKDERRVREHWNVFGSRISPLTHSPRLAINPPNALANLLYGLTEAEARIAAIAMGMDPDIGMLHVDTPNRSSLACDLQEPLRPKVDAFILNWLQTEPLRKADFWEDRQGNCRIGSQLVIKLCETADTWRRLVAPVVEYVAHTLRSSFTPPPGAARGFSTPLTQTNRRKNKSASRPDVKMLKIARICHGCGAPTRVGQNCPKCGREISREKLVELAKVGRLAAQRPEARRKHSETQRQHEAAKRAWRSAQQSSWPNQLTYDREIQPRLVSVTISTISSILGVCESYAADIRAGRHRPHPRHWQALAGVVGVSQT